MRIEFVAGSLGGKRRATIYFLDLFTPLDAGIDDERAVSTALFAIARAHGFEPLGVERRAAFSGESGRLVDYVVRLREGELGAKAIEGDNPTRVLREFYEARRAGSA